MSNGLKSVTSGVVALAFASMVAASANAGIIPYPNSGTYNPVTYTFTAAATGDLTAYIVGGFSAGYDNELGLLVNGVAQGGQGLNNHTSSVGNSYSFGTVTVGDTLTFVLHNLFLGEDAFSDPSLNVGYDDVGVTGHNHIYSTNYTAGTFAGVPSGTYVAFEDIPFPGSDFNYDDESFVFNNTKLSTDVPEPATWALFVAGFGLTGAAIRRRRTLATA